VAAGNWNEWKNALLTELYLKALPRVEARSSLPVASDSRAPLEERVLRELSPEFLRSDVDEFLGHLPPRYARVLPPEIIASHFELARALGSKPIATDWMTSKRAPYTVLTVCARDAPGLLAILAGALTGSGLDILSLDVFTRDDGLALDVFRLRDAVGADAVQPVDESAQEVISHTLEAALLGELDVAAAVDRQCVRQRRRRRGRTSRGPEVRFETRDALGRTPIEVRADDEPGLLYRIASTFAELGLDISTAKVATEKNQALDIFYVQTADGGPLLEARHETIRATLLEALQAGKVPSAQHRGGA
jgi:[protein-PII] uridylyltransferase